MDMDPLFFTIFIVAFIGSVILHEIAHGAVAYYYGDDTAKVAGRLSLNPLVHIDLVGSIVVPVLLFISQSGFLFGWAKPVPVNPFRLKNGASAYRLVSLAGIATNLLLAVISALVLKVTIGNFGLTGANLGVIFFGFMMQINLVLAIFNAMPFPGFDGWNFLSTFSGFSAIINKTPFGNPAFMAQYGFFISIFLIFIFMPVISSIFSYIFGLFISFFGL